MVNKRNVLIAKFMGYKVWETEENQIMAEVDGFAGHFQFYEANGQFDYQNNFNLMIKVAEKIETLGFDVVIASYQTQIYERGKSFPENFIIDADFDNTFAGNTYDAITGFIEWYNKKKQTT